MLSCSIWYEWVLHPASHKICKNNAITLTVYKVPEVNVLVKRKYKKKTTDKGSASIIYFDSLLHLKVLVVVPLPEKLSILEIRYMTVQYSFGCVCLSFISWVLDSSWCFCFNMQPVKYPQNQRVCPVYHPVGLWTDWGGCAAADRRRFVLFSAAQRPRWHVACEAPLFHIRFVLAASHSNVALLYQAPHPHPPPRKKNRCKSLFVCLCGRHERAKVLLHILCLWGSLFQRY